MLLPNPTIELVRSECAAFDLDYELTEDTLKKLRAQFPENNDVSHVLIKVLTLNKLYSTRINDKDTKATARHIAKLGIDVLLDQGSYRAVDLISSVPNVRKCYSFATKFCSWHNPGAFPIYDGYVNECLWSYKKQADYENQPPFADFHRQEFLSYDYERLVKIVTAFRDHYKLNSLTFKQLDKFLWRTGLRIVQSKS